MAATSIFDALADGFKAITDPVVEVMAIVKETTQSAMHAILKPQPTYRELDIPSSTAAKPSEQNKPAVNKRYLEQAAAMSEPIIGHLWKVVSSAREHGIVQNTYPGKPNSVIKGLLPEKNLLFPNLHDDMIPNPHRPQVRPPHAPQVAEKADVKAESKPALANAVTHRPDTNIPTTSPDLTPASAIAPPPTPNNTAAPAA